MDDARPKMCFSPSPPPPNPTAIFSSNLTFSYKHNSTHNTNYHCQDYNSNNIVFSKERNNMQRPEDIKNVNDSKIEEETTSDYKQWLHAMKLVARLPGGIPPEFRRKLWLSLADKYLKSKNVDWAKEEEKCFCEKWREDDEELGIQIVKDLHRTGSTLCTGPAGDLNQAKLKRVLLGYARFNPEVGYCQGFNMLGALILQVMDKDESESIKVMIYLVEGVLPTGYFCGSMGGLQADMAVFRELMQTKLPRLAKHLQKLQGPIENAYEPPLTNVFTMQWFLTMFCTCLPMSCVLRVWDLVLIEGSDVLLRTALALWSLLEERVLCARSADDFYGKMGSFSSELLNGHLFDSNGLIEKVVQLGPIVDIQKLRNKHLYSIAPIERPQGLQLYFDDEEPDIDENSRLAVATVWGIPWGRRGSQGQPNNNAAKQAIENKDRIALDISLLKKQYDKLRERQKQAQIILTTACSTASRQSAVTAPLPVNQLLYGRAAIVTNKGRRSGPPTGAIPPARKPSLPAVLHDKTFDTQLRRGETLYWRDAKDTRNRRDSLSWKEIKAERAALVSSGSIDGLKSQKIRSGRIGKSDSSSYSEESDEEEPEAVGGEDDSSTDTSLCDDDLQPMANDKKRRVRIENNLNSSSKLVHKSKKTTTLKQRNQSTNLKDIREKGRPKSWAPSNTEIPFMLMTTDSPNNSADENADLGNLKTTDSSLLNDEKDDLVEKTESSLNRTENLKLEAEIFSPNYSELAVSQMVAMPFDDFENTSTKESISYLGTTTPMGDSNGKDDNKSFDISNEGVTNQYFERVNGTERPTKLDLLYSLNEDENLRSVNKIEKSAKSDTSNGASEIYANDKGINNPNNIRCMDLLVDYSEKSSVACIEEAKTEISTFQSVDIMSAAPPMPPRKDYSAFTNENSLKTPKSIAEKRKDPRRFTLTRSSTMDIEKRFEMFEKRLSMEMYSSYKNFSEGIESNGDNIKTSVQTNNGTDNEKSSTENASLEKKIPSTADLEERFEHIQQQLVRDRNKMIKAPCDSENTEQQQHSKASAINNIIRNPKNDKINKQAKKDDDNERNERSEGETAMGSASDTKDTSSAEPRESGDINRASNIKDTQSTTVDTCKNEALEAKRLQSKKEPPDENSDEEIIVKESNLSSKKALADLEEINMDSKNSVERQLKETDEKNHKECKKNSNRTSPPSTEELEKRFCALEEKMSSSKSSKSNETQRYVDSKIKQNKSEEANEQDIKDSKSHTESLSKPGREAEADATNTISSSDVKTSLTKFEETFEKSTKRRLSEPPSTEDLEKRYEVLKRRMSSRNFEAKTLHNDRTSVELKQPNGKIINKTSIYSNEEDSSINPSSKHSPPSLENLEERYEKLQNKIESKSVITAQSPPTTEKLEERHEKSKSPLFTENVEECFDKLQSENDILETDNSNNDMIKTTTSTYIQKQIPNETSTKLEFEKKSNGVEDGNTLAKEDSLDLISTRKINAKISDDDSGGELRSSEKYDANVMVPLLQDEVKKNLSEKKEAANILDKNANKIKIKLIEELQAKIKDHSINTDVGESIEMKMALIEELKMKIDHSSDKVLKPTQISTRRRSPSPHSPALPPPPPPQTILLPSLSFNDETLESHATSAYCKSGKYEPNDSTKRKMVRRFSDLPSRADLENRLQFLEEQLSKTLSMQRRSSDSEVTSKARIKPKAESTKAPLTGSLEYRVQELERHLSGNRTFSMNVERSKVNQKSDPSVDISQLELAENTETVTGKELVRYSSHGEVGDGEHQNPINISINIQMTLNKDDIGRKKSTDSDKTDDLNRRLQFLEHQLKTGQGRDDTEIVTDSPTKNTKEKDQKISFNETESAQRIKKNCRDQSSDKNTNNVYTSDPPVPSQPSLDTQNSENTENKNSPEELKDSEEELSDSQKCLNQINNPCQIENVNCSEFGEPSAENILERDIDSQNKAILNKENETVENKPKESRTVDPNAPQDGPITPSSPIELKPNNLKENKYLTNSQREDNEISDTQELVQLSKDSKLPPDETSTAKSSKLREADSCETATLSEIENFVSPNGCSHIVPVEVNKKTLVLLLDNEPKAVKVRRLTRANTKELEDLFQALEKQLNDRGQQKITISEKATKNTSEEINQNEIEASQAMSELTKEIEAFNKTESHRTEQTEQTERTEQTKQNEQIKTRPVQAKNKKMEEEFDWGSDPIKYHLKKKTVYLPSTKELEARFRSLERQIKLLEDVEKIDVEQRLIEIERKIKLQYSLSHEKDLNKFLELCEGKDPDDLPIPLENHDEHRENSVQVQLDNKCSKHSSPSQLKESSMPLIGNVECRYRSLDLKRSKSKQSLKKQPIHPLEMLLDPSPDDNDIPTTGELEHRIRVMEGTRCTPSPPSRKSRSMSPPIKQDDTKSNVHILEKMTASPVERELPTAEELEARLEALEKEQCFNFKMQKNFQQFNQKLKDVVSPSLSFDEFKSTMKSSDSGHMKIQTDSAPMQSKSSNTSTSKTIRFCDKEQSLSQKEINSTKSVIENRGSQQTSTVHEGLGVMGIRLMRETSPLRRKGTHTGVPLRTGENINDQLTSIQNTIKSIDSLCEEKPYRKEKCQQYIDSLFSDSTYFAHKKSSLEDLTSRNLSRSTSRESGPYIRISDHSPAFHPRSMGSADSIRSSSPLRPASPLQYRSNRDLRREPSPRCRRDEDREEHESRVRRENLLPNNNYSHSILSQSSHSSLTKFHKVDSQLMSKDVEHEHEYEENLRQPTFSTIDNLIYHDNTNTSNDVNTTNQSTLNAEVTTPNPLKSQTSGSPILPLCQNIPPNSNTLIYSPAKLEIRHTTVTSTFYDRVLTEKQLERQHLNSSSTNNQSPMISPLFEKPKTNLPPTNNQIANKTFAYRYDKYVDSN